MPVIGSNCVGVSATGCTGPANPTVETLKSRLESRRAALTESMAAIDAALAALEKTPEAEDVLVRFQRAMW